MKVGWGVRVQREEEKWIFTTTTRGTELKFREKGEEWNGEIL